MIVPLIPLFLAASIGVNENEIAVKDRWRYGAEVIYELSSMCITKVIDDPVTVKLARSTKIACRPKHLKSLSCRFYDENYHMTARREKSPEKYQRLEQNRDEELFELNFRRGGLKEFVVSSSLDEFELDLVRALMGQLNIGADVYKLEKSEFETSEEFTTGVCETDYVLTTRMANDEDEMMVDRPYDLLMLRNMIEVKNRVMEMRRTRNLDECRPRVDYYFSRQEADRREPSGLDTKIESSQSEMLIGRKNFTSWTKNTIIVTDKLNSSAKIVTENITLTLENIVPAVGPLPTFKGPTVTTSIFPGDFSHFEKATITESSSEEEISSSDENNHFG